MPLWNIIRAIIKRSKYFSVLGSGPFICCQQSDNHRVLELQNHRFGKDFNGHLIQLLLSTGFPKHFEPIAFPISEEGLKTSNKGEQIHIMKQLILLDDCEMYFT